MKDVISGLLLLQNTKTKFQKKTFLFIFTTPVCYLLREYVVFECIYAFTTFECYCYGFGFSKAGLLISHNSINKGNTGKY